MSATLCAIFAGAHAHYVSLSTLVAAVGRVRWGHSGGSPHSWFDVAISSYLCLHIENIGGSLKYTISGLFQHSRTTIYWYHLNGILHCEFPGGKEMRVRCTVFH